MNRLTAKFLTAILLLVTAGCSFKLNPYSLPARSFELPVETAPIHFDDLTYDSRAQRVIVPAAESGTLALIDPQTMQTQLVPGFSSRAGSEPGAGSELTGASSAAAARGWIFALDRGARKIVIIDSANGKVVGSNQLQQAPNHIRYVSAANELWVTEESSHQIEIFSLGEASPPVLQSTGTIPVPNGPSNLVIDRTHGLAFTHQPTLGTTVVIQVMTHSIIDQWGNGCTQARGMAVDESRGYLFVACAEGKLVMMDINHHGVQITSQNYGGELNGVAYNPALQHIYLPSAASAVLAIFAIQEGAPGSPPATATPAGELTPTPNPNGGDANIQLVRLGTSDTAVGAGCVTFDAFNTVWVCDPAHGKLFVIRDSFPKGNGK